MTRKTWIFIGIGALVLTVGVAVVVLRRTGGPEAPLGTPASPAATPASRTPSGLSKEDQATRAEVERLEQTLPKDISQTWSPELRAIMDARARRIATTTTTP